MKQIILPIAIGFISFAAKASILIQAPGTDSTLFESSLRGQSTAQTYSNFLIQKAQSNPQLEESLYSIAENLDAPSTEIISLLNAGQGKLSPSSLNFTYDLTRKLSERSDLARNQDLLRLNCKVRGLLSIPMDKCPPISVDFKAIKAQWPFAKVLLIESASYPLTSSSFVHISKDASYNFSLYSDSHKAIEFKGTYSQFMQQHFVGEPLINGTCSGFSSNIDDFAIQSAGSVFFNSECIKPLTESGKSRTTSEWMSDNKSWLIPVGIALLGGVAYSLKDKKLVIEKP